MERGRVEGDTDSGGSKGPVYQNGLRPLKSSNTPEKRYDVVALYPRVLVPRGYPVNSESPEGGVTETWTTRATDPGRSGSDTPTERRVRSPSKDCGGPSEEMGRVDDSGR